MISALMALSRYSCESEGPTAEIDEALRSTGATVPSAFHNGTELLPKSVWVSIVQPSPTG
jgi:hypothetical protein